ncbi:MAG TPA: sensor histidine kinase, partial [Verrucomicrobiae bacterium]|nr:sensor histidine kinase [Verrucomicrobiae bacterium]
IVGTLQDISEREQDHLALKQTTEQLQTLSRRLLEMQETERRHLSRELHDEIGQALTALKINLQALQRTSDSSSTFFPRLADSISIVDRTLRQVRNLSLDLRPSALDDLGLFAALRWYADQQAQRAGLRVQLSVKFTETRLDPTLETACFRVAQEALTNVVRHAQAKNVLVELSRENDFLRLMVRDDGEGFDPARVRKRKQSDGTLGLMGMEERVSLTGGRIEFKSAPGRGAEIHAWFPLTASLPHVQRNGDMALK